MNSRVRDTLAPARFAKATAIAKSLLSISSLSTVPGSAADWTRAVAIAFANGADAVITLAENVQIPEETFADYGSALSTHPDAILGGVVRDAFGPITCF